VPFEYPIPNKECPIIKFLAPPAQDVEHIYLEIDNWVFCGWILKEKKVKRS